MKRILIDATTISRKTDGLTCYIINILKNFPDEMFRLFEVTLLVNYPVKRDDLQEIIDEGKFRILEASIPPIGPRRDIAMWKLWRKQKNNFDLFHSTSNQYPLCVSKGIATIHDITFREYLDEPWWTFGTARRYLDLVVKNSLKKAQSVIAVSNATKISIEDAYNLPVRQKNKINVIYEGWEHFINGEKAAVPHSVKGRYIFYAGTNRKHKNMQRLLQAFQLALPHLPGNINLVLSGRGEHLDKKAKSLTDSINATGERVFFTGYVSAEELEALFRNADAFIFPSLSEGFGIPVLEAFYFDTPLLCSNLTSLPEIAGDAAIYFDPTDITDMASAIQVFYNSSDLSPMLIEKGRERLKLFSWQKASNEIFELYKEYFR